MESKLKAVRDPVQTRGIKTKGRIIEAGRDLISERGYYNVTADEIAAAAGVSVGSFYAYFADKRTLFIALADEYLEAGGAVVSEGIRTFPAGSEPDVSSLITQSIRLLLAAHRRSPGLMRELVKMSLADREIKARLSELDSRMKSLIAEMIAARGVDRRKAAAVSFAVYHASEGVVHALAFGEGEIDEEAVLAETTRLLTAYVRVIL
jgi:AcrR family transcriptional regulator